jgi:predicted protein tyrosine phosphatase
MSEIIPHQLYLGDIDDAFNTRWLKDMSINTVITAAVDIDEKMLTNLLLKEKISHHIFHLSDTTSQDIISFLPQIFAIIKSSKTVLVHCMFGISRSVSIVLAYLMHHYKMYLDDAIRNVLQKRPCIFPNDGFILQLIGIEKSIHGMMTFLPNEEGIRKCKHIIHQHII